MLNAESTMSSCLRAFVVKQNINHEGTENTEKRREEGKHRETLPPAVCDGRSSPLGELEGCKSLSIVDCPFWIFDASATHDQQRNAELLIIKY